MIRHAFTYRTFYGGGLVLAALGAVQVAHAGYALPSPPPGWGGTTGAHTYQAANASQWLSGTVRTNAALNVGGKIVSIPAALRVAANAPTFAARFMFANPLLLTAGAVAFLAAQQIEWDPFTSSWLHSSSGTYLQSNGNEYSYSYLIQGPWSYSYHAACAAYVTAYNALGGALYISSHSVNVNNACAVTFRQRHNDAHYTDFAPGPSQRQSTTCPSGWYITPAGCVQTPPPNQTPQDEESFVERVAPQIQPSQVPEFVPPGTPIPVEQPVINPAPDAPTVPRPLIVPMGDPQPIPNTNPAQWRQPVIQVSPAPTPSHPWQVDLLPRDFISSDPTPIREPAAEPLPNGSTTPSQDADLCAKNPDILACQKPELDAPEVELPKDTVSITYTPENFGGGGGSCVAPVDISYFGHSARILDTNQACGWISSYLRPVALLVAAFISLGIVVGGLKTE